MSLSLWGTGTTSDGDINAYMTNATIANNLSAKTASFTAVTFTSITTAALTVTRSSPSIVINDTTSSKTATIGVAAINGDFFTLSTAGSVIIKNNDSTKAVLLGVGNVAIVGITTSGLSTTNIGASSTVNTPALVMNGDAIITQTRGPGSTVIGIATGAGNICANSVANDSCIAASQKLVLAATNTFINGPATTTGNISCGGSYFGSTISLDSVTIPAINFFRAGGGLCTIGMSAGNDIIAGAVANDLCAASGRALRLSSASGQAIFLHSPTQLLNVSRLGSLDFRVASGANEVYTGVGVVSNDTCFRPSASLFMGNPTGNFNMYGLALYFNSQRIRSTNWAKIEFKRDQQIGYQAVGVNDPERLEFESVPEFSGTNLDVASNGRITNNTSETIVVTASFTAKRIANAFGASEAWIKNSDFAGRFGWNMVPALDVMTGTGSFRVAPGNYFECFAFQSSGVRLGFNDANFTLTYTWYLQ
jgi:hypothetical protein